MRSKFNQVLLLTGVFALPFAQPPFAESALMEYFSVFGQGIWLPRFRASERITTELNHFVCLVSW